MGRAVTHSPRILRKAPLTPRRRQRAHPNHLVVATLMCRVPGRFATQLGLALEDRRPKDLFLWFLAAMLYGARISGTIVAHTHAEFVQRGIATPEAVLRTGWDGLVAVLDAGGYARYDFKTATKLIEVTRNLVDRYEGDLNALHQAARDAGNLEQRLKELGKGIGDVTVQIFLRELRGIWPKANPALSPFALLAAGDLGLLSPRAAEAGHSQADALIALWNEVGMKKKTFSDFESALVRLGRDYCRTQRSEACPMQEYCGTRRTSPGTLSEHAPECGRDDRKLPLRQRHD